MKLLVRERRSWCNHWGLTHRGHRWLLFGRLPVFRWRRKAQW